MIQDKYTLLEDLIKISLEASHAILRYYKNEGTVTIKNDGSPLTLADLASHRKICDGLSKITPSIPVISEESYDQCNLSMSSRIFWLIDPLDGTKEFINQNGEFTTNIALIENNSPSMGVICAPSKNLTYSGIVGLGAFKQIENQTQLNISTQSPNKDGYIVVGSRSHGKDSEMDTYLKGKHISEIRHVGSSLKFCQIAEGSAHFYPRIGRTMEWDTAAGHAILLAAGGKLVTTLNEHLLYNKPRFENPHFIASYG